MAAKGNKDEPAEEFDINTSNEFNIRAGVNLPNHSAALRGHAKFIKPMTDVVAVHRTRQSAYRHAAWLVVLADKADLPDEPEQPFDFDEILTAVTEASETK